MASVDRVRVQLLNYRPRNIPAALVQLNRLYFDTARVEGTDGVPKLVSRVSAHRVLLGSHAPFLIPEAALIRTHESNQLDREALRLVWGTAADRLLGGRAS